MQASYDDSQRLFTKKIQILRSFHAHAQLKFDDRLFNHYSIEAKSQSKVQEKKDMIKKHMIKKNIIKDTFQVASSVGNPES